MRHSMCVRRQLIWRRPELETQACRSLPLQKRDSVESSVGRAENFWSAEDANEEGGNLLPYIVGRPKPALTRSRCSLLLARATGAPSPRRQAQARPIPQVARRLHPGPAEFLRAADQSTQRTPDQALVSCQATPHHTTPVRGARSWGQKTVKMIQLKVRASISPSLPGRSTLAEQMRQAQTGKLTRPSSSL